MAPWNGPSPAELSDCGSVASGIEGGGGGDAFAYPFPCARMSNSRFPIWCASSASRSPGFPAISNCWSRPGLLERHQEGNWAWYRLAEASSGARNAELGRQLIDLIPENDQIQALDLSRLEEIKAERARMAADYFPVQRGELVRSPGPARRSGEGRCRAAAGRAPPADRAPAGYRYGNRPGPGTGGAGSDERHRRRSQPGDARRRAGTIWTRTGCATARSGMPTCNQLAVRA